MRRLIAGVAGLAVAALPGLALTGPASAAVAPSDLPTEAPVVRGDVVSSPLADKQQAERSRATEMVLKGEATPKGKNKVVKIAPGQYVELGRESEDSIFTVLGEFGDLKHNEIPEPDRAVDNTTIWTEDFSQPYYDDLLFSEEPGAVSMSNYYLEQSSGAYTVNGDVTDWATAPGDAAYYGADYCGSIVCARTWLFVRDSVNDWASSMSTADLNAYLAQFDVWDRYDYDGDGNFNEPDGYIDHFQSVHAGVGQETGGGALGSDAIWSHRWYAFSNLIGSAGPTVGGTPVLYGGTQIGDSDYWIGDYTIEPENGGVGVFSHEFGHDLGLPDLYDTSGNTGGAENSTAFWTLMSSGSYGNSGKPEDGIGTEPMHMGAWEKFQLGWLDYDVAIAGEDTKLTLGPAEHRTKKSQGAFVVLPDRDVTIDLGAPYEGTQYYYSGNGNDLDNTMTKTVEVTGAGNLTARVRYDIETDWDYAYLTVNGTSVETNLSTTSDPHGQNFGYGITGDSGGAWVDLTANLSTFAGQTVELGFRYWTDVAAVEPGFSVDAIALDGAVIGDAESDEGWTFDGFRETTGTETQSFFNAYVLENRQYVGFDGSLSTGPYNFGFLTDTPNWVEHFPYQNGLLISYWNGQYTDNNVGDHPGGGLVLPVDAHPEIEYWADGTMMRPRIQAYDSTFGVQRTDAITLHNDGVATTIDSQPAQSVFDDTKTWWTGGSAPGRYQPGWSGVDVPKTGTVIKVSGAKNTVAVDITSK